MKGIPKYIQILEKQDLEDGDLKSHLIKTFQLDGVLIDDEMKRRNPKSKQIVPCVPSKEPMEVNGKFKPSYSAHINKWVYCGNLWYVRFNTDVYEFAQYMAYNTETKLTEGPWDEEKYRKEDA